MNIIVPLAGEGKRFIEAGFPEKPFVDINGEPLIRRVIESLPSGWQGCKFYFVTRKEYFDRIDKLTENMGLSRTVLSLENTTEGAACTALQVKKHLSIPELSEPLLIVNGDQIVKFSLLNFNTIANLLLSNGNEVAGLIPVFKAAGPKWSYVKLDSYNRVTYVAEKKPVSIWATCGIYFWSKGEAFFDCAENMIENERRVNNEYYIAPVYNEILKYKFIPGTVLALEVEEMISLGTPEDVQDWLLNGDWE